MLWKNPGGFGGGAPFNAVESVLTSDESDANHSGYQGNVSAWCGSCHGDFHNQSPPNYVHQSGVNLQSTIATYYNNNPEEGGMGVPSYLFIVPVQDSEVPIDEDFSVTASSQVMCLSCHRAHAAATKASHDYYTDDTLLNNTRNMTRWDMERPSGSGLGCNKCHDKGDDKGD